MKPLEIIEVLKRFDFRCSLTGSEDYHIDHWIPQALGGKTDVTNVYPLNPELNLKKGTKNPFIFFEQEVKVDKKRFDELVFWLAMVNDMPPQEFREYTFEIFEGIPKF